MNQILMLIVLVPLVPAILLFWLFRSKAEVTGTVVDIGPFKDLRIDMGGAFAGYIIGVIAMFFVAKELSKEKQQIWTVIGRVEYDPGSQSNNTLVVEDISASIKPEIFTMADDGTFEMKIIASEENGLAHFPKLIFSHSAFRSATVHLDDKNHVGLVNYMPTVNSDEKSITLKSPITLVKN
jgi:hypothetical protein